jgi:large subunit ribosomal protein LP0
MSGIPAKKLAYGQRLVELIQEHNSIILVTADNVGSNQMQLVRMALRGEATLLMGKNTTIRKVLRGFIDANPGHPIAALYDYIEGNTGFVFTNAEVGGIREKILANKEPAPARVGSFAPADVWIEPGPTGCDPGQTSWFQALQIPTKINRGQIEMTSRVHLIKEGDKVGESEAALLQKLNIKPFSYQLQTSYVYDKGEIFAAKVLDITDSDLIAKLSTGISRVAALSLALGYPTKASVVHSINNAFKRCVSIAIGSDYKFAAATKFEEFLADPSKFIVAAPAAGGAAAAPVEEEEEEEEEEESVGGAGGLFGGSDSDSS